MLNVIRQWVIKTMMKNNTGVVQTLPKKDLIELNTQITAQRLMQNGVDPQALKNADQVENVINTIESSEKKNLAKNIREGVMATDGSRSAKVFDMEGKQIKDPKNIMGGKEINQQTLNEELMKTDNPYSDLVKTTNQKPKTIKEREAEVLAGMEKNNKEAVQRIRNRKMVEEAIDNVSPGFAGDRKYDAQLVADDLAEKRFGKDFYDLDQKQQLDLYDEAYTGLSDSRFKNKPDPEDMATGGRIGLKAGMTKRAFLKLMGGVGATIGAAKSGILSGLGKGAGKEVAKEVAQQTTSSMPPPYFFELANKIKTFGKPDKVTYADRVEIHRYRGKNGDEYELIEDLNTGDIKIQKDKTGVGTYGDKSFDTIEDRTEMVFKKGQADETTKGKPADEYEEYKVEFDSDGTAADASELDAAVQKEIIEEATGNAPSIKKAGGGIARMLGE